MKHSFLPLLVVLFTGFAVISAANAGDAGSFPATSNEYKILAPITHGDLTICPVVSGECSREIIVPSVWKVACGCDA